MIHVTYFQLGDKGKKRQSIQVATLMLLIFFFIISYHFESKQILQNTILEWI